MSKKLTTEEFIKKAKSIHGNKYDYSKVEYINTFTKVCIICPKHGEFWQTPNNHLNGQRCPYCFGKIKSTTEEFIEKAKSVHGNKYDYSKVEYVNNRTKVCIICPTHGEFWQEPIHHLNGHGCSKCYGNVKLTTEEFIEKAKSVHGNKYDYSKVNYVNALTKVCIVCPTHGEFWQTPNNHLLGQGCAKCNGNVTKTTEKFIEDAKFVHGNKYDYSKVEYVNNHTKVCIICPVHGEFWQTPKDHLNGYGCKKCGEEISKNSRRFSIDDFVKKAKSVHGNKYDYSKAEYVNFETPICIICPKHGEFWQTPHSHLGGHSCPYCANELNINEEKLYNILLKNVEDEIIRYKKFKWLKSKLPLSLDFYLPKYNVAIEYQGIQHFMPVEMFGGDELFKKQLENDLIKIKLCKQHNIKLLHFTFKPKDCEKWDKYNVFTNIDNLIKEINERNTV